MGVYPKEWVEVYSACISITPLYNLLFYILLYSLARNWRLLCILELFLGILSAQFDRFDGRFGEFIDWKFSHSNILISLSILARFWNRSLLNFHVPPFLSIDGKFWSRLGLSEVGIRKSSFLFCWQFEIIMNGKLE